MSRSILSSLCFILIPGLCFLGLYNIQTARFHSHMSLELHHEASRPEAGPIAASTITFGSSVTVRHVSANGGYLHSQALSYPAGSKQQQVALASEPSEATTWRVYNSTANYETRERDALQPPRQPVGDAASLKLQHAVTDKHLHSHDVVPPVSQGRHLQEVSAYGLPGFPGDANDDWALELTEGSTMLTRASPVYLRHRLTRCLLSVGATLPEWGLGMQEVLCTREKGAGALWVIEEAP
ncbi:MIR motif-containing protein [Mycena latifolia]|nr:MIR motif-containing protein [Mycena latifolia]